MLEVIPQKRRPFGKTSSTVAVESRWADESAIDGYTRGVTEKPKFYVGQENLLDENGQMLEHLEE